MKEKIVGHAVIAFGLGLLGFTFLSAYSAFVDATILARFKMLAPGEGWIELLAYAIPVGLLWVMGSVAGKIVAYGIDLLRATREESR
ncbi:MAG: hypothetical protein H5T49_05855 [Hadesarchaea archaeon]|nr:hypothetical protein [Hadesarchaea archaeon]